MSWLSPPHTKYKSFIDASKFKMTWNVYLTMCVVFPFLTIWQYTHGSPDAMITLLAVILAFSMVAYMKIVRKFALVAMLTGIVGTIINQLNIFTVINGERFIDLLWILVISLYVFYALGVRWGVGFLLGNFAGLIVYLFITPVEEHVANIVNRTASADIDILVNAFVTISVITYLLIKITQATKEAERQLINANDSLQLQNDVVLKQNNEKTVLLQEIHHRVKNNLQVISSLLRLQALETESDESQEQLYDAVNRVSSMALIHEKMYQSHDLARINVGGYILSLIEDIIYSQSFTQEVKRDIESDIDHIAVDDLVPIALIFNELVTNSLKHGLKETNPGIIKVSIKRSDDGARIEYADNGAWRGPEDATGFGTTLINTFVDQLGGTYTKCTKDGTNYQFHFPALERNPK